MSTNGLGLVEGTQAQWMEVGVHTRDSKDACSARNWFEVLWSSDDVSEIEDEDLLAAQIAWNRRQMVKPFIGW
ncbi:hypothetical protein [Pseudomonas sp. MWU13-2924]|uniref:hypothetical protein n=1 Tax=Pseudomonas sp. MWU13-2924 TaxID=2935076 RepID=UPI00200E6A85|nr:hypothetical protein [Pseudomonas sp. MWU13-2924]